MEYQIINFDDKTSSEIIKVLDEQHRKIVLLKNEIKELQTLNQTEMKKAKKNNSSMLEQSSVSNNNEQKEKEAHQNFLKLINDYKEIIDEIFEEKEYEDKKETQEEISEEEKLLREKRIEEEIFLKLPSKKQLNFKQIILRLKLEYVEEVKEINEILKDVNLSKDDLKEFKFELEKDLKKIEILSKALNEERKNLDRQTKNKIYFMYTSGGNIRGLEEIDKFATEFYDRFKGLLISIEDSTFKNFKIFKNTNKRINGVCQVKDYQTRIVYDRIGEDEYVIISMFIKKTDCDKFYKEQLSSVISSYKDQKERIKKLIKNPIYQQEQEKAYQEIFEKLQTTDSKKKVQKNG